MATPVGPDSTPLSGDPHKLTFAERRALFSGAPQRSGSSLGSALRMSPKAVQPGMSNTGAIGDTSASERFSQELFQDGHLKMNNVASAWPAEGGADTGSLTPEVQDGWGPRAVSSLAKAEGRFDVMVTDSPFGMNIAVKGIPRVMEVFPGGPAEAAGVRQDFVLVAVGEVEVASSDWVSLYNAATLPFRVTFDIKEAVDAASCYAGLSFPEEGDPFAENFEDFRCQIHKLPMGTQICQRPRTWARVEAVKADYPAQQAGVCEGDLLVQVGGKSVRSDTWFVALTQQKLPFELLFRRPVDRSKETQERNAGAADVQQSAAVEMSFELKHAQIVAKAGFSGSSIADGFSIFDVDLTAGPEMHTNLVKYYNFCRELSELSCTVSNFSIWNQNKKTNGFAKLIPAVHSSNPDQVRVFFFDDNIEWQGKAASSGIVNLRDVATGEFVEFGDGINGFSRDKVSTNTIIHHSSEYRTVLVQANILDAMEDDNYFDNILNKYLQPGEKAMVFMDINATIISVDSSTCKDMSHLVLGTMFEFITLQPQQPFEFEWDGCPPVKVSKTMHLKKLTKEVCKEDKALYKSFYTYENCEKLLASVLAKPADLNWALQTTEFSLADFKRQHDHYVVALDGATNEDGIVRSWFTCSDFCRENGHCIVLNTFGVDARKVILKSVADERQVLQFASSYATWDDRDVKGFEKIYPMISGEVAR